MTLTSNPWRHALDILVPTERQPTDLERDYAAWLPTLFPHVFRSPFADHHHDFWRWVWAMEPDSKPPPYVAIWGRGAAKSSSAEVAAVSLGARRIRRYALYLSETQDQADKHVASIADLMERPEVARFYPDLAQRKVGKYGHSRGWRRNRLRSTHFTIDAIGLDSAARGARVEETRPDLLILDDIDDQQDSAAAVERKIDLLIHKVFPLGGPHLAVLAVQNLIHERSIFSQLAVPAGQLVNGTQGAEFLANRIISGPVPAVRDLVVEQVEGRYTITGGTATWEGQPLATCQAQMDEWTLSAFMSEAQHDVEAPPGGMFSHLDFDAITIAPGLVPHTLVRVVVWCDPAVTDKDTSDSQGIQADGIDANGVIYRLRSWEQRSTPQVALKKAINWAIELGAEHVGVETDQGGETWNSVYAEACREVEDEMRRRPGGWDGRMPAFTYDKAGAGHGPKTHRASQMLADYERPRRILHVANQFSPVLVKALRRFPKTKPLDLVDAAYWSWLDLRHNASVGMTSYKRREGARR